MCKSCPRTPVNHVSGLYRACSPPPPVAAPLVPRCALLPAATPREGRFARLRTPGWPHAPHSLRTPTDTRDYGAIEVLTDNGYRASTVQAAERRAVQEPAAAEGPSRG